MVEVAAVIARGQPRQRRKRPVVNAIHFLEVSDVPSTYFFVVLPSVDSGEILDLNSANLHSS